MANGDFTCDICGKNDVPAQPSDIIKLRELLGPKARGYAHPACLAQPPQEEAE